MKRAVLGLVATIIGGCSGGDWVDAPQPCAALSGVIALGNMKATLTGAAAPAEPTDLKERVEAEIEKERKKGTSEKEIQEGRDALEGIVAQSARAVCGNVGKSYTGDWECNEKNQRVKCK